MKDNVLAQFASKLPPSRTPREAEPEPDVGLEDNLGAFGWLRGVRDRAVMLELRRKDGSAVALGYSWLERVDFDPSAGITLKFAGQTVKIAGRNLNAEQRPNVRLLDGLVRHRVPWLREAAETELRAASRSDSIIEDIQIE
jgi:hypothetical protein